MIAFILSSAVDFVMACIELHRRDVFIFIVNLKKRDSGNKNQCPGTTLLVKIAKGLHHHLVVMGRHLPMSGPVCGLLV